tara:strand:- start:415 stop:873 length:459 start_codon:yes stop_codon:yes gene_type:complete
MKSNIERVYSKLPQKKHNLGKHKVELSLADEINSTIDLIEPLMEDGTDYAEKLRDLGERIADLTEEVSKEVSRASAFLGMGYLATEKVDEVLNKAEDASKDLGIDPNAIDGYTKLEEIANKDYFRVKGVEDAYWEAVQYNIDRIKTVVEAQW